MTGWIRVFSVIDQQWQAKIDEGIVGLAACRFTPDSRHVMSWSDHQLRLTVWSLLEDTDPEDGRSRSYFVRFPKYSSSERGHSFRRDGRYLAYLERSSGKDQIGIIDCKSWSLIKVHIFIEYHRVDLLRACSNFLSVQTMHKILNGPRMDGIWLFGIVYLIIQCKFTRQMGVE
jgi:hypothetical protein